MSPNTHMPWYKRVTHTLEAITFWFCGLQMAAMVFIIFSQVIFRYVFRSSLTWSEEVGRFLFITMTFYGAAIGVKRGQHALLDSVVNLLPFKIAKILKIFTILLMIGLGSTVSIGLNEIMGIARRQVSAALQLPMVYIYILMFVGILLMLVFLIEKLYEASLIKENT